jgi:hypothetical protein
MEVGCGSESFMVASTPCPRDLGNMGRAVSGRGDKQGGCTSLGERLQKRLSEGSRDVGKTTVRSGVESRDGVLTLFTKYSGFWMLAY